MEILNHLYSLKRTGVNHKYSSEDPRSGFQKDYDRIVFSSAFRRLQNKTQVFPLPGSVFVHNRLTHSLEVSSVGRSLGSLVGKYIVDHANGLNEISKDFYHNHLGNVLAAACLCHDIGNPAFGHAGEDAIASFFKKNEPTLKAFFNEKEYSDFVKFEGNANSIRVLTQQHNGKATGGLRLTYSTLSAISKYPCESTVGNSKVTHRKKFGFLQSEKETFKDIALETGMKLDDSVADISYFRHPFTWLVEAADDICYHIIDFEDSQRLGIISSKECEETFIDIIKELSPKEKFSSLQVITDMNARIGYLRAKAIHHLIMKSTQIYTENLEAILGFTHQKPIFDTIKSGSSQLTKLAKTSYEDIYNHRSVVEIENAGYNVIYELLNHLVFPILKNDRTKYEKKAVALIPKQFRVNDNSSNYEKVLGVIDYISGMTDLYATDFYRKIKGIEIGMRN